jgi:hypothetical protein
MEQIPNPKFQILNKFKISKHKVQTVGTKRVGIGDCLGKLQKCGWTLLYSRGSDFKDSD